MPKPTKTQAMQRIKRMLDKISELRNMLHDSTEFQRWQRDTEIAIAYAFGNSRRHVRDFTKITYSPPPGVLRHSATIKFSYTQGLNSAAAMLESMIDEIDEYWPDNNKEQSTSGDTEEIKPINTSHVFLIHGRDHGTRDMVKGFLRLLGLEVIVLQEEPDQGRTVIEKFEQEAGVDFAVALFTPDDVGGLDDDNLQPRTRQNVILEFGYFIGKFGRHRVRAIVKGQVDIPSDYSGVLYIPLDDSGSWKMALIRELKSAGFDIDANRAL